MNLPKVEFWDGFEDRHAYEMKFRGYLSGAVIVTSEGEKYQVFFIDMARLNQDLGEQVTEGKPFFAEPGLIILAEVTIENIHKAVTQLWRNGYFKSLVPCDAKSEKTC